MNFDLFFLLVLKSYYDENVHWNMGLRRLNMAAVLAAVCFGVYVFRKRAAEIGCANENRPIDLTAALDLASGRADGKSWL